MNLREGGREGGRKEGRERGREGGREGGREERRGGRDIEKHLVMNIQTRNERPKLKFTVQNISPARHLYLCALTLKLCAL